MKKLYKFIRMFDHTKFQIELFHITVIDENETLNNFGLDITGILEFIKTLKSYEIVVYKKNMIYCSVLVQTIKNKKQITDYSPILSLYFEE